ncbi:phosphate/phosphite/phosphonate ABC transporter substrate-binding protein [Halomonas sp. M1]|uniref:phosphate/phosphite/phosphonate ABC transporter substrate-binding protein n=1 Tax=Halomonas sp. M1 TaxID=3035470 RepID=UPI0024865155|nr:MULTISPECIES: phosphate/phosphite/phosphonate ABC transporter substrate-binding protein [unclassified Halomonas]MDP3535446.1 phosphate/phosphite/phosphonate ABC transporter substrate-binding protein [Halomonas sp.]WFE70663.1 phosphate/phosphite/phosphonate ABC transporter substrate-binding protein [Halomonas sp. M1]
MHAPTLSNSLSRTLISAAVASAFALAAVNASADLSSRYVDNDGDMVADAPTDESQWVDPDTLVFAYTPVEDPAVYADVWSGFLDHLSEATGKRVQFFPVQSNAAQQEALRAGRLHVAGFNTGGVPVAVNCGGFRPFAIMASEDGSYGYEMEIITYPGSGIESVEDLEGRQLAFTSETSNSGFRAPSALLRSEYGLEADNDYKTAFSGSHDNSVLGVVNKDYDAAAIANSVATRMISRGVVSEGDYEIIYTSETFPTTAYGVAHNLKPELAQQIQDAFFSYDWEGTALEAEFANSGEAQFIPITYAEHWSVIRTIAEANGVTYDCD